MLIGMLLFVFSGIDSVTIAPNPLPPILDTVVDEDGNKVRNVVADKIRHLQ